MLFKLKYNHAQKNQIGILPLNGYGGNQRQSVIAMKMILYMEKQGLVLQHKLNGGEFTIVSGHHNYRVDAYEKATNTVYEILGCVWHGCPICFNPHAYAPGKKTTFGMVTINYIFALIQLQCFSFLMKPCRELKTLNTVGSM